MPAPYTIPIWKSSPFVRLLVPFIAGIFFQQYIHPSLQTDLFLAAAFLLLTPAFQFLPLALRFRLKWFQGILLNGIIFFTASFLFYQKDIRNSKSWFGHHYNDSSSVIISISEPLIEKDKSFKTTAAVEEMMIGGKMQKVTGKLILNFSKDSAALLPAYGDRILIRGGLQQIKNTGNPGDFDYEQFMRFQQIFHRAYLKKGEYIFLPGHHKNPLYSFIFSARENILRILRQNIRGDKKVTGICEALLIGYKADLDEETVQAYRNTGVVHIIIIAGMHLGLISAALVWLFGRLAVFRRFPLLKTALMICCIWLFALLTGASVPVLRSAVMFTIVITGTNFFRQAKVYNSLAASAFILLCYDPFLLWDAGFQLSYAAVFGIVWLQKPISRLVYSEKKVFQKLWELCSLSLAAQLFTVPLCIYYFHQLPTTFLLTNIICVPLFTIILFAEIFLVSAAFISPVATVTGKFVYVLTSLMNFVINTCNRFPLAVINNIYATPLSTTFLYCFIISFCWGLISKKKKLLKTGLFFLSGFIACWGCGKISAQQQKKIIIYNIAHHTAVDFINGTCYRFYGDDTLNKAAVLQNLSLNPSRAFLQLKTEKDSLPGLKHSGRFWQYYERKIMVIDNTVKFEPITAKIKIDILLVCGNPKLSIADLTAAVSPAVIVFDASNSLWKIGQWKKECEQLHLRCYITAEQGAFIPDTDKK